MRTADTAISCRRSELADVKQLAIELGREQDRTVPLWEVLRLLLDTYRRGLAAQAERNSTTEGAR